MIDFDADTAMKDMVTNALKKKVISVVFEKRDGSERVMNCTLSGELIPADKLPKGTDKFIPEDVRRVFDVDAGEWRSFRWDSLLKATL
jgi:hypothetical protein